MTLELGGLFSYLITILTRISKIKQFLLEKWPNIRYVHFPYNDGKFIYVACIFLQWRKIMIVCTMSNEIYFGTTQKLRGETMAMLPSIQISMLSLEESNEIWLLLSTMSTFFDNLKSIDYEGRSWPYSKHKVWIMAFANKYGVMLICLVPRSWSNVQLGFILFFGSTSSMKIKIKNT
jgi:hypothetical protein